MCVCVCVCVWLTPVCLCGFFHTGLCAPHSRFSPHSLQNSVSSDWNFAPHSLQKRCWPGLPRGEELTSNPPIAVFKPTADPVLGISAAGGRGGASADAGIGRPAAGAGATAGAGAVDLASARFSLAALELEITNGLATVAVGAARSPNSSSSLLSCSITQPKEGRSWALPAQQRWITSTMLPGHGSFMDTLGLSPATTFVVTSRMFIVPARSLYGRSPVTTIQASTANE